MNPEKPSEIESPAKIIEGEVLPSFKERTTDETIAYARWQINDLRNALGVMRDIEPMVKKVLDIKLEDIYNSLDSKTLIDERDYHEMRRRKMKNVTPHKD